MKRPVLIKYLGSKVKLAPWIMERIGTVDSLVEPFCGGAALFFEMRPGRGWLNDLGDWSTLVFEATRDDPRGLYDEVKRIGEHLYDPDAERRYYELRDSYLSKSDLTRAASQIVLSATGFNGLTRFDKNGKWNVAFGKRYYPGSEIGIDRPVTSLYPYEHFLYYSNVLRNARITNFDFEVVIDRCGPDDFVYCDPPYLEYNGGYLSRWTEDDVKRLRGALDRFGDRGGRFAVSEMSSKGGVRHDRVFDLWSGLEYHERDYKYCVGVNSTKTPDREILFVSG